MDPLEILKLIQENNKETKNDMVKRFDDYNRSITLLFTTEIGDVKDNIKKLEERVAIQNGSVRTLKEWRGVVDEKLATIEKESNKRADNKKTFWYFLIAQIVIVTIFVVGLYVEDKREKVNIVEPNKVEQLNNNNLDYGKESSISYSRLSGTKDQ